MTDSEPDSMPPLMGEPGTEPDPEPGAEDAAAGGGDDWESCSSSSSESSASSGDNVYKRYGWHGNGPPNANQFMNLMKMMTLRGLMDMGGMGDDSDDDDGHDVDDYEDDEDSDIVDTDDESSSSSSSSSEDDEDMPAEPSTSEDGSEGATIAYVSLHDAEFAAAVRKAPRIKTLSLVELVRTVDYDFGWKPDKDIEAVLKVLEAGTSRVSELELGDAEWAQCQEYSARLVRLLDKYSATLRSLSLTSRALVQPNKKFKKENLLKVVSRMRRLERLEVFYVPVNLHFSTYRGQFNANDWNGQPKKRSYFSALKHVELHLTPAWFERQFYYALLPLRDPGVKDHEYEEVCGGDREEERDDMVVDILQHKKDMIAYLDMSSVSETAYRLPIVDLFAGLSSLRRIALRVEYLDVTAKMEHLEEAKVVFHETTEEKAGSAASMVAGSDVWWRLRALSVQVTRVARGGPRRCVAFHWNRVLIAAAVHCTHLRRLVLTGDGWDGDVLDTLIKNNVETLEEVDLSECGDLPADGHLEALLAAPSLRSIKMKRRQLPGQQSSSSSASFRKNKRGKGPASRNKVSSSSASSCRSAPLTATEKRCVDEWTERGVAVEWA